MDRRNIEQRLRNFGSRMAIVIAGVACLQIGYVRYQYGEITSSLEQKLDELERQDRRTIDKLSSQLEGARSQVRRLREDVAYSGQKNDSLQDELRAAAESAQSLETRVNALSETLEYEPPFLEIRLEPTVPMQGLVAVAENRGIHPVQIAESRGLVWIGDKLDETGDIVSLVTVEPGFENDFHEIRLIGNEPQLVNEGAGLRGVLCLVYERELDDGSRPWTSEYWFEYQPGSNSVELVDQSRWPLDAGEIPCELELAERPW